MVKRILKRLLPESLRAKTRTWRGAGIAALAQKTNLTREPLSHIFLRGNGIELGSLNWPLDVPRSANVTYADAYPMDQLRRMYPQFASQLLPVSIVTKVDTLEGIPNESQDFVIVNHVVEHSENPIGAIRSMLRVLRVGGIIFMSLPDKRFTFDHERPVTPFEHLVRDDLEGPEVSREDHYREVSRYLKGLTDPSEIEASTQQMLAEHLDTHFHVWTQAEMFEMLSRLQRELAFPFDIEVASKTGLEMIFVLKKTAPLAP